MFFSPITDHTFASSKNDSNINYLSVLADHSILGCTELAFDPKTGYSPTSTLYFRLSNGCKFRTLYLYLKILYIR